jgi:guanylate kinase
MQHGIFFLVAGPSGAGKTTVLKALVESSERLVKDVSITTRPPRPGEQDGLDYFFWTREKFELGIKQGEFLEYAQVHGSHYYGTSKQKVQDQLNLGNDVIKDIDVQGADQVRKVMPYPYSVGIFLAPPSPDELKRRLKGRGTEDEATIARRIESARAETARIGEFDFLVWNDRLIEAIEDLRAIRRSEHLRQEQQQELFKSRWNV